MFFSKRLKKPDPKKELELHEEIEKDGGLEKKDIPAMIISAFLVFLPISLGILLVLGLLAFLL